MTHDLTCVVGDLIDAAHRHARQGDRSIHHGDTLALARAAVAFAIQLAAEEEGRDLDQLRALERDLMAKLREPPPLPPKEP